MLALMEMLVNIFIPPMCKLTVLSDGTQRLDLKFACLLFKRESLEQVTLLNQLVLLLELLILTIAVVFARAQHTQCQLHRNVLMETWKKDPLTLRLKFKTTLARQDTL